MFWDVLLGFFFYILKNNSDSYINYQTRFFPSVESDQNKYFKSEGKNSNCINLNNKLVICNYKL